MSINAKNHNEPSLRLAIAIGILYDYPSKENPWSLMKMMRHVKEAGFESIETWASPEGLEELKRVIATAQSFGLAAGGIFRTDNLDELKQCLQNVKLAGGDYLALHYAKLFKSILYPVEQILAKVEEMYRISHESGVPLFMETHRDSALQDPYRTLEILKQSEALTLNLDLSHYVLSGECSIHNRDEWREEIAPLLSRSGMFHGRISNGQQIQIGLGTHESEWTSFFIELWAEGMFRWLLQAKKGDVCNFTCELLGPPYALTKVVEGKAVEMFDRWEQTLLLKSYAI